MLRFLLNVIWLVLGGFWLWLLYLLAGAIACLTIIGIPFGIAAFRIGFFALWPFGRTVVNHPAAGVGSMLGNVLWVIFLGWWLALAHVITAIAEAVTIIGIPLALANLKLIPVSLFPLGKRIVPVDGNTYSAFGPDAFGPDAIGPGRTGTAQVARPPGATR